MESWGSSRVGDNRVGHLFDSDFSFFYSLKNWNRWLSDSEFGTSGSSNSKLPLCNDLQVDLHNRYVDFAEWSCRQLVLAPAQVTSGRFIRTPPFRLVMELKKGQKKAIGKPLHYSAMDMSSFLKLDYSWALLKRLSKK
jgi:hypothetical protein